MKKPDPIPCYACKGDPSWRDPVYQTSCTVCHGSGKVSLGPTAAEEWEEVAKHRAALRSRQRFARPASGQPAIRKSRPSRKRMRAAARAKEREQARRAEALEAKQWRASRPDDWNEQLDHLKAEYQQQRRK